MEQTKSLIREVLSVVIISLMVVIPIRMYIAQPFVVSGQSMDKTLANGNYLIIDEVSYRLQEPQRGDVIVFRVPEEALAISNYSLDKKMFFIKRIIGLPGETVEINGDSVKIFNEKNPKGIVLNEPYAFVDKLSPYFKDIKKTIILKGDEYFVMGDNRHNSSDSRFWGPLKKENIKGKTFLRLWPFNKITAVPGAYNDYQF
ncbi:MAG: signal peptidase I [Candidatus Paceibacterota bacterium]